MRENRTTLAFLAAALAAAALPAIALTNGCSRAPDAPAGMPPAPVRTVKPTVSDVPVYRDYPGLTMSVRTVEVFPRASGWIDSQGFENGQQVAEGQLLYSIDPRPYQVTVEKAKADIAVVEADLRNYRDMVTRNRPLVEVSAISQQAFDQMLANQRSAEAMLDAKRAALDEANLNLSFTRITSPVTGRASATNIYAGTNVSSKDLLVTIRQIDPLWVEFEPVQGDLPALRRMQKDGDATTTASLPSGEWSRNGKVVFVDNTVNRATNTIRTRIEVPNPDRMMVPGAYVNVHLKVQELVGALSVPEAALVYQTAAATLWTVDAQGKAHQKVVKPGPRGGAGIVISEGITADDVVVVEGLQKLHEGAQTMPPEVMLGAMKAAAAGAGAPPAKPAEGAKPAPSADAAKDAPAPEAPAKDGTEAGKAAP
jgi:membrane fusion protein (multidrug efflux system)